MKRTLAPIALAALTLALALAPAAAAPRPETVKLKNNSFAPDSLTIKKRTMVRFRWAVNVEHDVTKASGPGRHFQSTRMDDRGDVYKHRFRKAGRYRLLCTLHDGMRMTVRVKRRRG
jgi:plastocyanin